MSLIDPATDHQMRLLHQQSLEHLTIPDSQVGQIANVIYQYLESTPMNGFDRMRVLAEVGMNLMYAIYRHLVEDSQPPEYRERVLQSAADSFAATFSVAMLGSMDLLVNHPEDADAVARSNERIIKTKMNEHAERVANEVLMKVHGDAAC